ncbi:MAG: hypothetical protein OEU76_00380, partial [Cyclobacteriaceae bacterium]|nr:hypothetical protein [Cyclobacteriaceae bacterium]
MKRLILLMLLGAITFSCQKKESSDEAATSTSFENERNAFFSSLGAPAEVAAQLQATAADFNAGLLNNAQTYASYTTNEVKAAANLGIYLADLNYSIAFTQSAYVNDLFTASHQLSQTIGIEQSVLDFLMKRYTDNINQNDSVKAVIEDLFASSTADLK